eukprot:COSAG04_NODE_17487_length_468_cov_0.840108_2_plen_90_part_00
MNEGDGVVEGESLRVDLVGLDALRVIDGDDWRAGRGALAVRRDLVQRERAALLQGEPMIRPVRPTRKGWSGCLQIEKKRGGEGHKKQTT